LIVVDANVLAGLLISPEDPPLEELVYAQDPRWIAPLILRSDFRNTLAISIRRRKFEMDAAIVFMEQAEKMMKGSEFQISSADVISLAARSGCTAYDCEYVALAIALKIPLVTRDREILAAFPSVAVEPKAFLKR